MFNRILKQDIENNFCRDQQSRKVIFAVTVAAVVAAVAVAVAIVVAAVAIVAAAVAVAVAMIPFWPLPEEI